MKAKVAEALTDIAGQMSALADDMRRTVGVLKPQAATPAGRILEAYRDGYRAPVQGPLTYGEALALVRQNERLLAALKDVVNVPCGSGAKTLRARIKAHYNACAVIAEAEAE